MDDARGTRLCDHVDTWSDGDRTPCWNKATEQGGDGRYYCGDHAGQHPAPGKKVEVDSDRSP